MREMQRRAHRAIAEGYVAGQDADGYCERTAQAFHELAYVPGASGELEHVRVALAEAFSRLEKAQKVEGRLSGLPTGPRRVRRHPGRTVRRRAHGFGCSTRQGQVGSGVAVGASRGVVGHPAVFFSLEMPKHQVGMRAACVVGGIHVGHWRNCMLTPVEWTKAAAAAAKVHEMPLYVEDTAGLTTMALRSRLRRFQAEQARRRGPRIKLVVVDYLQLVHATPVAERSSRERAISEVAQDLKEIAKEFAVAVVAPSQMNRAIEQSDRLPRLSDLRESGNIEQAADTVIFIHEPKGSREVQFVVEKNRNGPNDIVSARFVKEFTRFEDVVDGGAPRDTRSHAEPNPHWADR